MSEIKTFVIPEMTVPVAEFDVAVAGGGTTGVFAAIASARTGARTVLIESKGYLGGTVVEGGTALHSFFNNWKTFGKEKVQLVRGIPSELVERLIERGGCTGHCEMESRYEYDAVCTAIDTEIYKIVAHEMVAEAGVTIYLNTFVSGVIAEKGTATELLISNHAGMSAVRAKSFVDCTAYGDVCAGAGAAFTEPNDHAIANPIGVGGVNMDAYAKYFEAQGVRSDYSCGLRDGEPGRIIRIDAGSGNLPGEMVAEMRAIGLSLTVTTMHSDYFMFLKLNYNLPESPTSRDAMTAAELELRHRQERAIALLRKFIPGCERAYIARSSPNACIRRARCITCDYDVTHEDTVEGRHFDDEVFRYGFHDSAPRYNIAEGGSYGFPYRAMLPVGVKNVYATGMMITTDWRAHMSTRNTVSCMAMGQAAGTAAALCAADSVTSRGLDFAELRAKLMADGVYLG